MSTLTIEKEQSKFAFIGGGNMADSLIGGLIASGLPATHIQVGEPNADQRKKLASTHGVICFKDNIQCIKGANVVIFAVKPQILKDVVIPLQSILQQEFPLLISIVAGIRSQDILGWVGKELAFVRGMPNTPALVNQGATGLWANALTTTEQRNAAEETMLSVGEVVWVQRESLIDVVTGISGSGPAYFYKLMEILINAAEHHGLSREAAKTLVVQTALGAATMAHQSDLDPEELRHKVTSPGGTTEAGIRRMQYHGLEYAIRWGISAAVDRSRELSSQFGGQ